MAVYGFGSYYSGTNVTDDFIDNKCACIGWGRNEALTLYSILEDIRIGDIVYLKSYSPKGGLIIKAIGIVKSNIVQKYKGLGTGISVEWIGTNLNYYFTNYDGKYNVRANTLFIEKDNNILEFLVQEIIRKIQ